MLLKLTKKYERFALKVANPTPVGLSVLILFLILWLLVQVAYGLSFNKIITNPFFAL